MDSDATDADATEPDAVETAEICAVVVNYRCAAMTVACLESLRRAAPSMRVYVVDNASGDDSEAVLTEYAREHLRVAIYMNPANDGFGAGCNRGIDIAVGIHPRLRHVLLVNPDTTHEPGFVEALRDCAARHPAAGVVGGLILEGDTDRVWYESGAWRPWTLGPSHESAPRGADDRPLDEYRTGFVTGCLMLLDADLLRDGLRFDERFFLYCEDVDLCREIVARGRELWVTRRAVIRHASGGTQSEQPFVLGNLRAGQLRWITRNKVLLARKRLPFPQRVSALAIAWLLRPVAGVLRFGRVGFLPAYFRALAEGHRVPL